MYAIIESGGKQYKVTSGDIVNLELFEGGDQKSVKLDRVLMVGGEGSPKFGSPLVKGASVAADIIGEVKGDKIDIQKYKRRKGYHKKQGHRQKYTQIKITGITV
jgi:large subunit ribosomal protein L21